MATYKVPQDVEADDKLIGPFSFRQFIYLIIVALAGVMAWGLSQLFIGLIVIPLPVMIFFGALALPLRKDQPMEIYMAAIVSFYLKPHLRKWDPDGVESLIEVSAPKTVEVQRTKDLSQSEAEQRLGYLANIVDSGGWAIRGVSGAGGTAVNNDIYLEANSATDVLDTNTSVAQSFDQLMNKRTEQMHEEARERMLEAVSTPAPAAAAQPAAPSDQPAPQFNPYPTAIHQTVVQPLDDAAHQAPTYKAAPPQTKDTAAAKTDETENSPSTSDTTVTAGIINLANNPDLSIETIAHEAQRLKAKEAEESDEVIISLR